nr:MAG TPA: hypothetical protein [Caudoviricetes sp.]
MRRFEDHQPGPKPRGRCSHPSDPWERVPYHLGPGSGAEKKTLRGKRER